MWIDVKVNDFYIPEWLRLNLEAARKKRGVKKSQASAGNGVGVAMYDAQGTGPQVS